MSVRHEQTLNVRQKGISISFTDKFSRIESQLKRQGGVPLHASPMVLARDFSMVEEVTVEGTGLVESLTELALCLTQNSMTVRIVAASEVALRCQKTCCSRNI